MTKSNIIFSFIETKLRYKKDNVHKQVQYRQSSLITVLIFQVLTIHLKMQKVREKSKYRGKLLSLF